MLGAGGRSAGALCTDARRLYVDELGDARTANAVGAATGNSTHASSMETRACYHMHLNDFIALDAVIDSSAAYLAGLFCARSSPPGPHFCGVSRERACYASDPGTSAGKGRTTTRHAVLVARGFSDAVRETAAAHWVGA